MKKVFLLLLAMVMMTGSCLAASGNASGNERTTSVQDGQAVKDVHKDVHKGDKKMVNRIAVFETNLGNFSVELFEDETPITTENFIDLAEKGFYDGVIFHRVIDGFMIQGGDPEGTGMGGAKDKIKGEFLMNGVPNDLRHERGVISMARAQNPNSASSQFFICHKDSFFLDGQYAAFGRVVDGMDAVDEIAGVQTDYSDRPLTECKMKRVFVEE